MEASSDFDYISDYYSFFTVFARLYDRITIETNIFCFPSSIDYYL